MKRILSACGRGAFYLLLFLGVQYLTMAIYFVVYAIVSPGEYTAQLVEQTSAVLLIGDLTAIGLFLLTAPMRRRAVRVHVSLYPLARNAVLPIILLGLCANFAVSLLLGLFPFPASWWETYEASASVLSVELSLSAVLAQAIVGPIAEELCFRGLLYTRLRSGMPRGIAALVSALVFGIVHGTAIWFCYSFLLGLVMVWLFQCFESLWGSILFHISFNGINFLLVLVPDELTVPLYVIGCAGCAVVVVWLLHISRQRVTEALAD